MDNLEKYYLKKHEQDQAARAKLNDSIKTKWYKMWDTVPNIIQQMIVMIKKSRPDCPIIMIEGKPHASSLIYKGDDDEYGFYDSTNLLLDGRIAKVRHTPDYRAVPIASEITSEYVQAAAFCHGSLHFISSLVKKALELGVSSNEVTECKRLMDDLRRQDTAALDRKDRVAKNEHRNERKGFFSKIFSN